MWCSKCKTEYRDGFTTCSDCGEELVRELQTLTEQKIDSVELVHFKTVYSEMDFIFYKAIFDEMGIPVLKKYKGAGEVMGIYLGSGLTTYTEIEIYIPQSFLEFAGEVLEFDTGDCEQRDCPECDKP